MPTTINPATSSDFLTLVRFTEAFYTEQHLPHSNSTLAALDLLLADPQLGIVFLIQDDAGTALGYFILTYGYSLERGGKTALLDELYIIPAARSAGLGKSAIAHAITFSAQAGCRALHLEVDHINKKARASYERAGFKELPRAYLTLML